jgi:hypothetical protein
MSGIVIGNFELPPPKTDHDSAYRSSRISLTGIPVHLCKAVLLLSRDHSLIYFVFAHV